MGGEEGWANSAPTLGETNHSGNGPYMSGANGYTPGQQGANNSTQYYDDNPYGWTTHQQDAGQGQGPYNGNASGQYWNGGGVNNYPPPPPQAPLGGTGFPTPPGSQPPPPQQGR